MNLTEYQRLLDNADWFYDFSDDPSVWRRGEAESSRLLHLATIGTDDFKRAYNTAYFRVYTKDRGFSDVNPPFPNIIPLTNEVPEQPESPTLPKPAPTHLGDGVYASFDGYHIQISVNDHRNPPVVALEPSVMEALIAYYKITQEKPE